MTCAVLERPKCKKRVIFDFDIDPGERPLPPWPKYPKPIPKVQPKGFWQWMLYWVMTIA